MHALKIGARAPFALAASDAEVRDATERLCAQLSEPMGSGDREVLVDACLLLRAHPVAREVLEARGLC